MICHCFGSSFSFLKHLCILRKHSPPKLLGTHCSAGVLSSQSNLQATPTDLRCFRVKKTGVARAGLSLPQTARVDPSRGGSLPPRPAPRASRARGFEPALRTRERRESGNASVPAGGCPAFVSSFPSGGEDMVRSRFQTDPDGGGGLGLLGGKRASVGAGSERRARSAPGPRTG